MTHLKTTLIRSFWYRFTKTDIYMSRLIYAHCFRIFEAFLCIRRIFQTLYKTGCYRFCPVTFNSLFTSRWHHTVCPIGDVFKYITAICMEQTHAGDDDVLR